MTVPQFLQETPSIPENEKTKMEDDNSMTDRILRQIEDIVNNRQYLKEFSIVPTDANTTNKSPVLYEELNLGLESWCVKHIYRHVCRDLFEIRNQLSEKKLSYYKMESLNRLLIGALLINPEMVTFWNMKRELVECDLLNITKELHFVKIVLSNKPKSNEAFTYRRWLLKRLLDKFTTNALSLPTNLLETELAVTLETAEKAPNNYHSWTHRIWCMEHIAPHHPHPSHLLSLEYELSASWISTHISEYSGFHYRHYVLNAFRTLKCPSDTFNTHYNFLIDYFHIPNTNLFHFLLGKPAKNTNKHQNPNYLTLLLYDLLNTVAKLAEFYASHETLWCYRRFLFHSILQFAYNYCNLDTSPCKFNDLLAFSSDASVNVLHSDLIECVSGEKQPKLFKSEPNRVQQSKLYEVLVGEERAFVARHATEHSKRHRKWLKYVMGVAFD